MNKSNGTAVIRFGKPRPMIPERKYRAVCRNADWDWTQRYKRNQAKFVFDQPIDYYGPMYPGDLCALYPLGGKEGQPYASPGSKFYKLWCQANGSTPTLPELSKAALKQMFEGRVFEIEVETVKRSWNAAKKKEEDLPVELWYSVVRNVFRPTSLTDEQPSQPSQPVQPCEPSQPANHENHHNHLTLKPYKKPCNQLTSKPPRFPDGLLNEFSGETHAASSTPGGTEKLTSNSVPRSQKCDIHKSEATWWKRGEDWMCALCHPNPNGHGGPEPVQSSPAPALAPVSSRQRKKRQICTGEVTE